MPDEGRTLRRPMAEMQVQVLPARLPSAFTFMNRIERYLQQSPDPPSLGDFYIVSGDFGRVCVSHDVARYIVRLLNRWFVPTWIEFPDRVGSIVRVSSTSEMKMSSRNVVPVFVISMQNVIGCPV